MTAARWRSTLFMIARAVLGVALLVSILKSGGAWESLKGMLGVVWLVAILNLVPFIGGSIEAVRLGVLFASPCRSGPGFVSSPSARCSTSGFPAERAAT